MDSSSQRIIVNRDGQRFGPYTVDEARAYLAEGRLLHSDKATIEGTEKWLSLATILNIAAPAPPLPAAAPPPPFPAPLSVPKQVVRQNSEPIVHDDPDYIERVKMIVGPKYEYYLRKWYADKKRPWWNKAGNTWNWAGFFWPVPWLAYRKMFLFVVIAITATVVLDGLLGLHSPFLWPFVVGFTGNNLYKWHVEKKIRETVGLHGPLSDADKANLIQAGGTSTLAVVLSVIAFLVVVVLLG
jgi:hypothetical protein